MIFSIKGYIFNFHGFLRKIKFFKSNKRALSDSSNYNTLTFANFKKDLIEDKKPSILVFGAEWSGNTEIMNNMIERVSQEYSPNLYFYKVNLETQKTIFNYFGVLSVPTTIILKDGIVMDFKKGFVPMKKLKQKIKTIFHLRQK